MFKKSMIVLTLILIVFLNYEGADFALGLLGMRADVAVLGGLSMLGVMGLIDFWIISKFWRKREAS